MKGIYRTNFLLLSFLTFILMFNIANATQTKVANASTVEQLTSQEGIIISPEIIDSNVLDVESTISADANKNWTIMVYLDGDCNLEDAAIEDLYEMEIGGGSTADVNVIVLIDRIAGYFTTAPDWTEARYYQVQANVGPGIDSIMLGNLGEVNMGSATTLQNFIEYCFANFPADSYCLDIWDHGAGVWGAAWDDTTGNDRLTLNEMQSAVSAACDTYAERIDVFAMDCCVMNIIEMGYEMREYCDYFVASEENIPWDGFDYTDIVSDLLADPNMSPVTFCELLVDSYASEYRFEDSTCLSAINLTIIDSLVPIFTNFSSILSDFIENENFGQLFYLARASSRTFYNTHFVDIIDLAQNLETLSNIELIDQICLSLIDAMEEIIIFNWQHPSFSGTANGMSVFLPTTDYNFPTGGMYDYADRVGTFSGMDWQPDTNWGEFIRDCYDHFLLTQPENPPMYTIGSSITIPGLGLNDHLQYFIYMSENAVYDFSCSISSGDVDIQIGAFTDNSFEILGVSNLVNPADGNTEHMRLRLNNKYHYLFIQSKSADTTFTLTSHKYTVPTISMQTPYNYSSGSLEGDDNDHYQQSVYQYYQIELPVDSLTFILNNSATANYEITITFSSIDLILHSDPVGAGNSIQLDYECTTEIVAYITIVCVDGQGSFQLFVDGTMNHKAGLNTLQLISLFILGLFAIQGMQFLKRKKKR
ncbi:MAG: clostripain-related cysteine peptidase [Candidatus Heimdallarchaeota archaeon]